MKTKDIILAGAACYAIYKMVELFTIAKFSKNVFENNPDISTIAYKFGHGCKIMAMRDDSEDK